MKRNLLSLVMFGAAMLFACCTPQGGDSTDPEDPQGPQEPQGATFAVSTANITHNSVDVTITPTPADAWWFATLYSESDLNIYAQGDAMAAIKAEVEYLLSVVDAYNKGVSESDKVDLLTIGYDSICQGEMTMTASYLSPETSYVVIVVEVDGKGVVSTTATTHKFTSAERPVGDTVEFVPMMSVLECCGDYYYTGTNDNMLALYALTDSGNVAILMSEFFTDLNTHDGVGSFVVDPNFNGTAGTFWPGEIVDDQLLPTLYCEMGSDNSVVAYDVISDGSMAITKGDDGNYTINVSFVGENGSTYIVKDYTYTLGEDNYLDDCASASVMKLATQMKSTRSMKVAPSAKKMLKVSRLNANGLRR